MIILHGPTKIYVMCNQTTCMHTATYNRVVQIFGLNKHLQEMLIGQPPNKNQQKIGASLKILIAPAEGLLFSLARIFVLIQKYSLHSLASFSISVLFCQQMLRHIFESFYTITHLYNCYLNNSTCLNTHTHTHAINTFNTNICSERKSQHLWKAPNLFISRPTIIITASKSNQRQS